MHISTRCKIGNATWEASHVVAKMYRCRCVALTGSFEEEVLMLPDTRVVFPEEEPDDLFATTSTSTKTTTDAWRRVYTPMVTSRLATRGYVVTRIR